MKQRTKRYIIPFIAVLAMSTVSCFDLYNELLDNADSKYRLTLAETSGAGNGIRLLNFDAEGNIIPAAWNLAGTNFWKSSFADFNKDGNMDLLIMKSGGDFNYIYYSEGKGNFNNPLNLGIVSNISIAVADFDNNGYPDIVVGATGAQDNYYLNNYPSVFSGPSLVSFSTPAGSAQGLTAADFDGDGDKDIFIGKIGSGLPSQLWINEFNTGGTFTNRTLWTSSPSIDSIRDAASGDLDNDGDIDIIEVGTAAPFTQVWINAGSGYFTPGLTFSTSLSTIKLADFDSDGDLDAYAGSSASPTNYFFINHGNAQFTEITHSVPSNTTSIAIGDIDLDGDIDIIVSGSALYIYKNDGNAQFSLWQTYPSLSNSRISIGAIYK